METNTVEEELLFIPVIVVQKSLGDSDRIRDLVHGSTVIPVRRKELRRAGENRTSLLVMPSSIPYLPQRLPREP